MVFTLTIETNSTNTIKTLNEVYRVVRKGIIEKGMDKPLNSTLPELKEALMRVLNDQIKSDSDTKKPNQVDQNEVVDNTGAETVSKAKEDLYKYLFGVDPTNLQAQQTNSFTRATGPNIFIVKGGKVKLRLPITQYASYEQAQLAAKQILMSAIYYDPLTGKTFVPGDNVPVPKPECSNQPGDSARSKEVFESRKHSTAGHREEAIGKAGMGAFVTFTMFQDDTKRLLEKSVDAEYIVKKVMDGDIDSAKASLTTLKKGDKVKELDEKLDSIQTLDKKLPKDVKSYATLNAMINNLKIAKSIDKQGTTYKLVTTVEENSDEYGDFFDRLQLEISIWTGGNFITWFTEFVNIANRILKAYEAAI